MFATVLYLVVLCKGELSLFFLFVCLLKETFFFLRLLSCKMDPFPYRSSFDSFGTGMLSILLSLSLSLSLSECLCHFFLMFVLLSLPIIWRLNDLFDY